ncbi:MAG TPA: acetate uptake transporter [Ktedonobacteraceae bacterium]
MAQFAAQGEHAEHAAATSIANAAPLGLTAFAITTAILSCVNAGFLIPSAGLNAFLGLALVYGGAIQVLAGMWEFKRGNVISATAFSSYGGFWIATALMFLPGFGILGTLNSSGTLHQALAVYFLCWTIITGIFFLGALRTNVALLVVLGLLLLTYLLLTIAEFASGSTGVTAIGGWLGILTALAAWYTALADLLHTGNGTLRLPLGQLG